MMRERDEGVIYTRGDEIHQTSVLSFVSLLRRHISFLSTDVWFTRLGESDDLDEWRPKIS